MGKNAIAALTERGGGGGVGITEVNVIKVYYLIQHCNMLY